MNKKNNSGKATIIIIGIVVVALLTIAIFAAGNNKTAPPITPPDNAPSLSDAPENNSAEEIKTFNISGVNYKFSLDEIRVKK